jgi:N-formylglutamate amidohydrolase
MPTQIFELNIPNKSPLLATAIHDGHQVRSDLLEEFNLTETERLREEDPHTGYLARQFENHILGTYSRFETDLNRARDKAIYQKPEDAWGLQVWKNGISQDAVNTSLANYDNFYKIVTEELQKVIDTHGYAIVYDLHSYNHMRDGADGKPADPQKNPEINLGLGNMDLETWRPVVDAFTSSYKENHNADIRENVKFDGGHFMHYLHKTFGEKICVIAIEFKKTFMDEWTNALDQTHLDLLASALKATEKNVLATAQSVNQPA